MLTIIDKSLDNNVYEQGQVGRLYVKATTNTSNVITYRWYTSSAPSVTISNKSFVNIHNFTPNSWSAGGGTYNVEISDVVTTQTLTFDVELKKAQPSPKSDEAMLPYKDPKDSGDLPAPSHLTQQINHTKGGFHLYNNLEEMLDASSNFQRLQYGQYAYFKYDNSSVDFTNGLLQDVNLIDKVYRFIVLDPKQRYIEFNEMFMLYDNWSMYIDDKFVNPVYNAKTWKLINQGNGENAKVQITLNNEGYLPIFDTNNNDSAVKITQGGTQYSSAGIVNEDGSDLVNATYALVNTNDFVYLAPITITITNGVITRLQSSEVMGPFKHQPKITFLTGEYTYDTTVDPIKFQWVLDTDWEEKVFLNCVPDNVTTKIVNGQLSAMVQSSFTEPLWTDNSQALDVITPTYDMSRLVGHNAIQVLEDIIYPYQNVTISLTGYNNNTPVFELVENGNKITLTRVAAEIKNFDNLVDNSSVELKIVHGNQGQILSVDTSNIISKTKQEIVAANGVFNFTVNINDPSNSNNTPGYFLALSAVGTEYGENYDGGHAVYGKQQFDWAHRIYYIKDSNASITGNYSVPNDAGRTEPTLTPQGIYQIPKTAEPEYVWFLIPADMSVTEIGLPEQNIPFYQYATDQGNKFVTTNVNITVGSASIQYAYKGYRSSFKTASDVTVTIL
jgi:hypothetical protein